LCNRKRPFCRGKRRASSLSSVVMNGETIAFTVSGVE
jgi:hypothetical protein